jgi:putative tricarboxylic transport membrane protein
VFCLAALTPVLAEFALKFGAFEFFWLGLLGVLMRRQGKAGMGHV